MKRGEVYEIENKKFFTFGGAYSIDKAWRTEHYTWWKQELPDPEEYNNAANNLEKHNYTIDYIITHTCPQRIVHQMGKFNDIHEAELTGYLDWIFEKATFKRWYFGHWHIDKSFCDDRIIACYEEVYSVDERG